jgi:small-conductance mechanosensitive channel
VELLGIRLVGFNALTGHKVLLTIGLTVALWLLRSIVLALLGRVDASGSRASRIRFWSRQGVSLVVAALAVVGLVSIWFDNPANLTTAVGLITAGLAFALQKVVTALAGYFVILRGSTFTVGDRIVLGGVRGDVVALGFFQTTIMEMGQPPPVQNADPAVWVESRQFTGRIVTVSNARIFDEAVFNYTRDFPFIWEEMRLPIAYRDDRDKAEQILLEAARKHAVDPGDLDRQTVERLERDFRVRREDFEPSTYWRLTDNWLEITVRFIARDHGVRKMKDALSREVLAGFEAAGIGIASATFEITGLPQVNAKLGYVDSGS